MKKRVSSFIYSLLIALIANVVLFNSGPGLIWFFGMKYYELGVWSITAIVFVFALITIRQIQRGYLTLRLIRTLTLLYIIAFLITVFFKNGGYGIRLVNLDINACLIELEQYPLVEILNVLLWIPFGAWLRLRTTNYKIAGMSGFIFSFAIETTQYIFSLGVSDINDLIANTLGFVIGFWLVDRIKHHGIYIEYLDDKRIRLRH